MKKDSSKSLKWLTGVTTIFGALYLLMLVCQTCGLFYGYPVRQTAEWMADIKLFQASIAIFRFIGAAASYACIIAFLLNSISALKKGTIFPKKNVGILFGAAISSFIFIFCNSNMHIVFGTRQIELGFVEIIVPVVICALAIIYRIAVEISKENSLTI